MDLINWIEILNSIFFIYVCALFTVYLFMAGLSFFELRNYTNKNKYVDYKSMLSFERLPSVSVIAPAFNEEKNIVENIRCLLALQYSDFEIIIVNDGSTDNTLNTIINHFDLVRVERAYENEINTREIKAIYQSTNPAFNKLVVIDKENGGKSDALNAGINLSQNELFLAMDVDCIIEYDALLKMVKPFIDDNEHIVIASGGVIRIANSCEVIDGNIVKVNFPTNFWAKFQVLEYFRAFTLGRMAWSKLNGLLIISGAFGMFDRKRVVKVGGYDVTSVGEDLELVVRLRRYMHEVEKKKYRVAFIPDPLCWTEVPESFKVLARQRNRWTRGAIDVIHKHKKMLLNPKYGRIGMLSFPIWILFEWLAPFVQIIGLIYFAFILINGLLNFKIFIILSIFLLSFSVMYSVFAVYFEVHTYNKYKGMKYLSQIIGVSLLEMFIYQPLNMVFSLRGHIDYYFKKNKKNWGTMTRTGFNSQKEYNKTT